MNEKDLEDRLRRVVDGPQPSAPPALRNFLRELPETAPSRPWAVARLAGAFGGLRGLISPVPAVRRAKFAFAVSVAVVFGLVGGGLLMSARQHAALPAATPSIATTATDAPTPRRSTEFWPPYKFMLKNITGFQWSGILSNMDGNYAQAMPVSAVALQGGGYVGVSTDEYGKNGLVFSPDGIYWNWDPATEVDPAGVMLASIATNGKGQFVVAGAAVAQDGSKDGRIYISADGHQWTAVADATQVFGGTAIRTVVYGPSGYVALGWNDADPTSRTVREWLSTDGVHCSLMGGVPIEGTGAYVVSVQSGYVLSGSAQAANDPAPPIWFSSDGHTWLRGYWKDRERNPVAPIAVGPILSATSTSDGIFATVRAPDGSGTRLLWGSLDGMDWAPVSGTDTPDLMSIASIDGSAGRLLVATNKAMDGHVYVSNDEGATWSIASNLSTLPGAPIAQTLLQLGPDVLCYGHPAYMMGVWLGYPTGG